MEVPTIKVINPSNTFVVADFHFDHKNIIRYCDRPFGDVEHMNSVLLKRYKAVVRPDSTVIFLGDMCHGRGSRSPRLWLKELPGRIVYIKGNHDYGVRPSSVLAPNVLFVSMAVKVEVVDMALFMTHRPRDAQVGGVYRVPLNWWGWVVHGHVHNYRPFLDLNRQQINVSVDVTDFRPVRLQHILEMIRKVERR